MLQASMAGCHEHVAWRASVAAPSQRRRAAGAHQGDPRADPGQLRPAAHVERTVGQGHPGGQGADTQAHAVAWHPVKNAGLIFHSDRGSQYASEDFRSVLAEYGITTSMSRKGNCRDSACSGTLFGSLKVQRLLHGQRFVTQRYPKDEAIAWLLWYDRGRLHSTLAHVSTVRFEQDRHATRAGQASSRLCYGVRIPGARSSVCHRHLSPPSRRSDLNRYAIQVTVQMKNVCCQLGFALNCMEMDFSGDAGRASGHVSLRRMDPNPPPLRHRFPLL